MAQAGGTDPGGWSMVSPTSALPRPSNQMTLMPIG